MVTRIKLCGMTRPKDAELASRLGTDAVGMIFYNKSARNVSIPRAREIISVLSPLCSPVAVVVDPAVSLVESILGQLDIQLIQFHGEESPAFCEQFGIPYIKVVRMRAETQLEVIHDQYASARGLLLDTFDKKLVGGTGRAFDWDLISNRSDQEHEPDTDRLKLILAGGIGPDNAADAIRRTGIRHIDVNSGVESAPGVKDHEKIKAIMRLVQAR